MRGYLPVYEMKSPDTLEEALETLAAEPKNWTPFAGGTDLMVLLAAGNLPAGKFLNLWALEELRGIEVGEDFVTLGALTTYTEIRQHPILAKEYSLLCQAAADTGGLAIQNRGTLGGNIINASPAADSPPALLVYDAQVELASREGRRWVPYNEFHTGYKQMAIEPSELLTSVRIPRHPGGTDALHYYRKVGTRAAQAISKVVMAAVGSTEAGKVTHCRIALGSVGPTVVRCVGIEQALTNQPVTAKQVLVAQELLAQAITPIDDIRSTQRYRLKVSANLLEDFLIRLSQRSSSNLPAPT